MRKPGLAEGWRNPGLFDALRKAALIVDVPIRGGRYLFKLDANTSRLV